ncbi:MAG: hypothetical protein ACRC8K_08940, partial [Waterburya sp.]
VPMGLVSVGLVSMGILSTGIMSMGLISLGMHNMSVLQIDTDKVAPQGEPDAQMLMPNNMSH